MPKNDSAVDLATCVLLLEKEDWSAAYAVARPHASNSESGFVAYQIMLRALMNGGGSSSRSECQDPSQTHPVPKTIFQFWDSERPPSDIAVIMDNWRTKNPDFEYILFNEMTALEFINAELGQDVGATFKKCFHAAMKSDFFRVCYAYVKGGIYVDADEACILPLRDWLPLKQTIVVSWATDPKNTYVHNWFFATPPNTIVFRNCLRLAAERIRAWEYGAIKPYLWDATGPANLTRGVIDYYASLSFSSLQKIPNTLFIKEDDFRRYVKGHHAQYKETSSNWRNF